MAFYTESQRALQDHFDSRRLADRLETAIIADTIDDFHRGFIESRDFFFLSTVTADGEPTVSYKGGDVGVVRVVDDKTLAFPAYDGNGMFLSMGNIAATAKIGMLFIDFETPHRVRVQATASFEVDDELLADYPGAIGIVRATVDQAFVNCARYIHKHTRAEASPYVPDADGNQPHPSWKRIDSLQDVLSPADESRTAEAGGTITQEEYAGRLLTGES
ncbi:MAG: pyridoxamine 5'-phosphate oxidase family protein [Actinomycetota bacterium]